MTLLFAVFIVSMSSWGLLPHAAQAAELAPPVLANASIARRASGQYRYESLDGREVRGSEHFQILVRPDESRTLIVWHDLAAKNAQFTVVQQVDPQFQPVEAYVSYWNEGRYKGSAFFRRDGAVMRGEAEGPAGRRSQAVTLPARFSFGAHPVAGDGWHTANYLAEQGGVQQLSLFSLEAGPDVTKPVQGSIVPLSIERLGEETVEVPAGRFTTTRYRLAGMNDIWVTGPDRVVVKSEIPARKLRYVLIEYAAR